jgi:hypothetical protein
MYNFSFRAIGGKELEVTIQNNKELSPKIKEQLRALGEEAKVMMSDIIESSRKRESSPTSKPRLSSLIDIEEITNTDEEYKIGIGNIARIESQHRDPNFSRDTGKGWMTLNYGSAGVPGKGKHPRGRWGSEGSSNARFVYDPQGNTMLQPKKPVIGIHFIESTINALLLKFQQILGGTR